MILPSMISTGVIGIESRLSMVPRSISRVTESAVKISIVMVRIVPTRPGHDIERGRCQPGCSGRASEFRTAAPRRREWRDRAAARSARRCERADRRARRDRIGGVRRDQQRRTVAAPHRALEARRDLDREQHRAGREQPVEFGLVVRDMRDLEILRVLERREDRAADVALLLQQHRRRQMTRSWC